MADTPVIGPIRRDLRTSEFLDGTARRELLIHRCVACGRYWEPRVTTCSSCGAGSLETVPARGTARVVSWAVVHGAADDGTATLVVLVIAQLDEGPWWWSKVLSAAPADIRYGTELILDFARHPEGESIPVFRLAPAASRGATTPPA